MNIFLYLEKGTWVHRLDPRTKIFGTLALFTLCLCFNHPLYVAGVSLVASFFPSAVEQLVGDRGAHYWSDGRGAKGWKGNKAK